MMIDQSGMRTAGLILAGGQSSRFGGLKQLAPVAGQPLLERVVRAALASALARTILVLGFSAGEISRQLGDALSHPALSVVTNTDWRAGMATSVRAGMARIDQSFDSVMIILGDFPLLNARIIDQVLQAYRESGKGICLPVRGERWGHPICISSRYFDSLLQVEGDQGAREIIKKNWQQVYQFHIPENGCFVDIDTELDMERFQKDYGLAGSEAGCLPP
jgi:molybdenum cofactor cytidylyltransferase